MRAEVLVVALGLFAQAPPAPTAPPVETKLTSPAASVSDLGFLTGAWTLTRDDSVVEEHWTAPRGGTLFGIGRTIRGNRTLAFEFLRIETRTDGLYYLASPAARPPTPFKLTQLSNDRATFENPARDFPKRIAYWREGERLCAEVSGTVKGKPSAERWCWERAAP